MKITIGIFFLVESINVQAQFTGAGQRVVVIDQGLMNDYPNLQRVYSQLCATRSDEKTDDSSNATAGFVHYDIASTCPNGFNNYTSMTAVQLLSIPFFKPSTKMN